MATISDEAVCAWLDNEATREQGRDVEAAMKADPDFALHVAQLARVSRMLPAAYAETFEAATPERFEALLAQPARNKPAKTTSVEPMGRSGLRSLLSSLWQPAPLLAACASLVVGVLAGAVLLAEGGKAGPGFVTSADGAVIANRELAAGLASLPSGNAGAIGVSLSLRDNSGRFCRQFDMRSASGLACLEGGAWRVEVLSAPKQAAGARDRYVMADGASDPAIAAALERVGAAQVLNREEEADAIAHAWK